MANGVFASAKGRMVEKATLPIGTDAIMVLLLKSTGLQADATLRNYTNLATLLGSNTEADFTNYARKLITSGMTTVVNTGVGTGVCTWDIPDITWTAAGGATNNTLGKMIVAYRPTSSTLDSGCLPLTFHDFTATTTGTDLLASIAGTGLALAS